MSIPDALIPYVGIMYVGIMEEDESNLAGPFGLKDISYAMDGYCRHRQ